MSDNAYDLSLYRHIGDSYDHLIFQSQRLGKQILPHIHRGIRNHTSHGVNHSLSVIKKLNEIIDVLKNEKFDFSPLEIRLLYIAAWLHDIGNLKSNSRSSHSLESCIMLKRIEDRMNIFQSLLRPLQMIVKYHSSNQDLAEVEDAEIWISDERVRIKQLCSIFRFADACHMGEDRAFDLIIYLLFDEFDEISISHWEANKNITSVKINCDINRVQIFVIDKGKAEFLINDFIKEFHLIKTTLGSCFPFSDVEVIEIPDPEIDDYTK